jgi:hypothetical protein
VSTSSVNLRRDLPLLKKQISMNTETIKQTELVFLPWIGPLFESEEIKLLVRGDSFWETPSDILSESAQLVVGNWQAGVWNIRYLLAAARLLTGKLATEVDRRVDLNKYAYTNYVQVNMEAAGYAPTQEQMLGSRNAFRKMIRNLKPTHVLATGRRFWQYMPSSDGRSETVTLGGKSMEIREYSTGVEFCLTTNIPHLSIGFSPSEWKPAVDEFLTLQPSTLNLLCRPPNNTQPA